MAADPGGEPGVSAPTGRLCGRGVAALGAVLVLALALARVTPVTARFDAQISHTGNTVALLAVYPGAALTAEPVGNTVTLNWQAGRNGSGTRVSRGATTGPGTCPDTAVAPVAVTATTEFVDPSPVGPPGTWSCYRIETTLGPWTSVVGNPTVAVQVGFVVTTVRAENGGVPGKLDVGDRFVVGFNQPVDPATGPTLTDTVCATTSGAIVLAAIRTGGGCTAGEANRLGQLDSGTMDKNTRWSAAYAWTDGDRTLTVTLTARVAGPNALFTAGPWTFQPTTTPGAVLSASGRVPVCASDVGGARCRPTADGAL